MELTKENAIRKQLRESSFPPRIFTTYDPMDFENWAWHCVRIRDKLSGCDVAFTLNRAQRRVLAVLEWQRLAGHPIRAIILKARQWGCSTLIQMYMAWIQIIHRRNWHSVVCAHGKGTSGSLRGMFAAMLAQYPRELWAEEEKPAFKRYEGSANTLVIAGRGCRVTLATAENPEATRGLDVAMAQLSEVAFYKATPTRTPQDLVRAVCSGIPPEPYTLIVLESTANGQGNYFHDEWHRADSDKERIFVPWHEIDIYSATVDDYDKLWQELTPYERNLWHDVPDITLEQLAWYHKKRREYPDDVSMMREYPSSATEAFDCTTAHVFAPEDVERLRQGCRPGMARGEVECNPVESMNEPHFTPTHAGNVVVWGWPRQEARPGDYVVGVDVGGRSEKADWSVVSIFDTQGGRPCVVAQWRGHCDMDLLAWKAMALGRWYANALLVIESNTLESTQSQDGKYVIDILEQHYPNLYRRQRPQGLAVGFHTNRATKGAVIAQMIATVRNGGYEERDAQACAELSQYERLPNGSYAARLGCHDDIVMSRAIALYVIATRPASPTFDPNQLPCNRWW